MMLSVLMPAYNAGRYVAEAIESVLAQSARDLELLVVDDGSTDDTLAVARSFAGRDARVKVFTHPNAGIAHTMNRGLDLASGEWVFCMHADDVMLPERLERQSKFIERDPDVAVVSSLVYYINGRGKVVGRGRSPYTSREAVRRAADAGEPIAFNHPAAAMKRSVVKEVGGYRQAFWPAEDCDLWNRIVGRGHRVLVQDEYLLKYRIHGASASISRNRLMQQKALWIRDCIRRRRAGEAELTWEQFLDARRRAPLARRISQGRDELGHTFYQAAIHHLATGNYARLLPTILAATALKPGLVLGRLAPRLVPGRLRTGDALPQP